MVSLYTTSQVAIILNMKPTTVRKYISEKQLKASFVGRSYLVSEETLKEFIDKNKH